MPTPISLSNDPASVRSRSEFLTTLSDVLSEHLGTPTLVVQIQVPAPNEPNSMVALCSARNRRSRPLTLNHIGGCIVNSLAAYNDLLTSLGMCSADRRALFSQAISDTFNPETAPRFLPVEDDPRTLTAEVPDEE